MQRVGLGGMTVHTQQSIGNGVCFLAGGTAAHDARSGAAQILHEYDPQRDGDGPELADGQRLNALISAHETAQGFRIKSAVGVGDERPGHSEYTRVPVQRTIRQFGQQPIKARREIFTNFPDLLLDDVIVVEQPFGGGRYCAAFARRCGDIPISGE